ncbi:MAG: glycosyltransferase family 4 protein [Candidatus Methanoperedens sp.]|nr:glycosyltransferase family 4 protein [Candidatus Methanoperedens sp.]
MKIAFVYDAVYPWIKGGAEKRIYELGRRLAERGNEVHVFGVRWWDGAGIIEKDGMVLHGVCAPMELYVNGRRSIPEAIVFSIRLIPALLRGKFDIIDVSAFPYFSCFAAKLASVLKRTPIVITWHEVWGDYWYEYMGWRGFFGKKIEYAVSKLTSNSIAVSALTGNNLRSLGTKSESIRIIPNGIDLRRIENIIPSAIECDVLFAGRLIKEKNIDMLLETVDHLRNTMPGIKCHIIGDGPEKERLTELANKRGLLDNVTFFGFMEYDEMIARIKSSKVLVLPSSREGFGMVVIEAFACKVPVVTIKSRRNAASLLVNEKTGFVVDPDARELGSAIRTIITDGVHLKKTSLYATAQGYDWDRIVPGLARLYEELI